MKELLSGRSERIVEIRDRWDFGCVYRRIVTVEREAENLRTAAEAKGFAVEIHHPDTSDSTHRWLNQQ